MGLAIHESHSAWGSLGLLGEDWISADHSSLPWHWPGSCVRTSEAFFALISVSVSCSAPSVRAPMALCQSDRAFSCSGTQLCSSSRLPCQHRLLSKGLLAIWKSFSTFSWIRNVNRSALQMSKIQCSAVNDPFAFLSLWLWLPLWLIFCTVEKCYYN